MTPDDYCRELEAYLTRKNDGHLIRIVGPSFERVLRWAEQGIPIKVAYRGIDRCFERYYAKGARRRPVRIEFCEADVLDVFDEWRRAVGVVGRHEDAESGSHAKRRESLATHIDRVIARLTTLRGAGGEGNPDQAPRVPDTVLDEAVRALDEIRARAERARGGAREQILEHLQAIDTRLLEAARERANPEILDQIRQQAGDELRPFRERMPEEAWQRAVNAAADRALRERARLPVIVAEA